MKLLLFILLFPSVCSADTYEIFKSPRDPVLDQLAMESAQRQADLRLQGHHRWERVFQWLLANKGWHRYKEICAETWERQENASYDICWAEAFKCWNQSPGHWAVACRQHTRIGFGLANGSNGIWYFSIIAEDDDEK